MSKLQAAAKKVAKSSFENTKLLLAPPCSVIGVPGTNSHKF